MSCLAIVLSVVGEELSHYGHYQIVSTSSYINVCHFHMGLWRYTLEIRNRVVEIRGWGISRHLNYRLKVFLGVFYETKFAGMMDGGWLGAPAVF